MWDHLTKMRSNTKSVICNLKSNQFKTLATTVGSNRHWFWTLMKHWCTTWVTMRPACPLTYPLCFIIRMTTQTLRTIDMELTINRTRNSDLPLPPASARGPRCRCLSNLCRRTMNWFCRQRVSMTKLWRVWRQWEWGSSSRWCSLASSAWSTTGYCLRTCASSVTARWRTSWSWTTKFIRLRSTWATASR